MDESITITETVKKIPEYNACLTVEEAICCLELRQNFYDQRKDDCYLLEDEEPVSPPECA